MPRYYYQFGSHSVSSVALEGTDDLNEFARVELLSRGFQLDVADQFSTGIGLPIEFENGGFLVEFDPGTNLTTLGETANIAFSTVAVPEPSSLALGLGSLGLITFFRTKRRIA